MNTALPGQSAARQDGWRQRLFQLADREADFVVDCLSKAGSASAEQSSVQQPKGWFGFMRRGTPKENAAGREVGFEERKDIRALVGAWVNKGTINEQNLNGFRAFTHVLIDRKAGGVKDALDMQVALSLANDIGVIVNPSGSQHPTSETFERLAVVVGNDASDKSFRDMLGGIRDAIRESRNRVTLAVERDKDVPDAQKAAVIQEKTLSAFELAASDRISPDARTLGELAVNYDRGTMTSLKMNRGLMMRILSNTPGGERISPEDKVNDPAWLDMFARIFQEGRQKVGAGGFDRFYETSVGNIDPQNQRLSPSFLAETSTIIFDGSKGLADKEKTEYARAVANCVNRMNYQTRYELDGLCKKVASIVGVTGSERDSDSIWALMDGDTEHVRHALG